MKIPHFNSNERVVAFDVDDTLVMWDDKPHEPGPNKLELVGIVSSIGNRIIKTETFYLTPHKKHIQKLKGYARTGYYVIVWSAGGGAWAKEVVERLGLQDYVDYITAKPCILYDDLPLNEALGERKYFLDAKDKSE